MRGWFGSVSKPVQQNREFILKGCPRRSGRVAEWIPDLNPGENYVGNNA
jgi:hypothetical protein